MQLGPDDRVSCSLGSRRLCDIGRAVLRNARGERSSREWKGG